MRASVPLLAALLAVPGAVGPALAAPLDDDSIPLEVLMAPNLSGAALSFGAGGARPAVAPPARLAPAPALTEQSLLLSEEGDGAEGGPETRAAQDLDEVLRIDAGVTPAPAIAPAAEPAADWAPPVPTSRGPQAAIRQ